MLALGACSSGATSGITPAAPAQAGALQNARGRAVSGVTTITTPGSTQVLAVSGTGTVYFGGTSNFIPDFCLYVSTGSSQCSSGGLDLFTYAGGSFTKTSSHGPYFTLSPSFGIFCSGSGTGGGACSMGNVSAINADGFSSVIWASDYAAAPNAGIPFSVLQWGAGAVATLPPPMYDENFESTEGDVVSILRASNGQFWLSGGGPQPNLYPAAIPSSCLPAVQDVCSPVFLANGPRGNVWGMTHLYGASGTRAGTLFFEFSPSGALLKTYRTTDIAVRIAGTPNAVWYSDYAHNAIGKIDGAGKITKYKIATANAGPYGIAADAGGSIWFAEYNAQKVGHLRHDGHIIEYALSFQPFSVATTPPGCTKPEVWVGSLGDQLAEVTP